MAGVDAEGARVIVRLTDQTPLLLEKQIGEGHVLLFASGLRQPDQRSAGASCVCTRLWIAPHAILRAVTASAEAGWWIRLFLYAPPQCRAGTPLPESRSSTRTGIVLCR